MKSQKKIFIQFICGALFFGPLPSYSAMTRKKAEVVTIKALLSNAEKKSQSSKTWTKKQQTIPGPREQVKNRNMTKSYEKISPPKTTSYYSHAGGDLSNYEKLLDRQIQELFQLTKKLKNSQKRGEMWLRLAELYVEKADLIEIQIQENYEKAIKDYSMGKRKSKPMLNLNDAIEYNKKSLQLYEWFLKDFPNDPKAAQALYFLGYNHFALGDVKKGKKYYEMLVKKHPDSVYIEESHFALGDYYFDREQWANAYREYAYVIKDKQHKMYQIAVYKGAWCLYRLAKGKQAIQYLENLIASKEQGNLRIANDALRDLVVFYGEYGDPATAAEYFERMVGEDHLKFIEKLAYYYSDKGYKDHAKNLFKKIINSDPMSEKAIDYQIQTVHNYHFNKDLEKYKTELFILIKNYGSDSEWGQKWSKQVDLVKKADAIREQLLRNFILHNHQTAQNSKAPYTRKIVLESYPIYLQNFPSSPLIVDMHFYYGEILYDVGEYEKASREYKWVVDRSPQSNFGKQAAQNLLIAAEKALPSDKELIQKIGTNSEVIELGPEMKNFVELSQWYLSHYPKSDKEVEVLFRVGRLYYLTNHFQEAREYFKLILQKYPKSEQAEYSANLLLDIFNLQKDYANLEKEGQNLLAIKGVGSSKAGKEIQSIIEKSKFKKAQDLELSKNFAAAAEEFIDFSKKYPFSHLVTMSIFNAAVNFQRAGDFSSSRRYYSQVVASGPKENKEILEKSTLQLADLEKSAGRYEKSADLYQRYGSSSGDSALKLASLSNSASLYEALGNYQKASESYLMILESKAPFESRQQAQYSLADLYRKSDKHKSAKGYYESFLKGSSVVNDYTLRARYWSCFLGLNEMKGNDFEKCSKNFFADYSNSSSELKSSMASYAAKLRLVSVQKVFNQLIALRFSSDSRSQQIVLKDKIELIKALNNTVADVVRFDSPEEIIDGIVILGEANQHLYDSLMNAPLPKGLNEAKVSEYRSGVLELAKPFQQKAIESFKSAVLKARDFQVYNSSYKSAYTYLAKHIPAEFKELNELVIDLRPVNWSGVQ